MFLCLYFINTGIYNYKLKFEDSSFSICSRRTLSVFFGGKKYHLEISNDMLKDFRFMKRKSFLNDILLIQMLSCQGRKSAIRIPMTSLSKSSKLRISTILNNIIERSKCQKS